MALSDDTRELPECVRRWRKMKPRQRKVFTDAATAPGVGWRETPPLWLVVEQCLEWLATASPAVIVAASSGDADVLRNWGPDTADDAVVERATIVDSATHVVLPRDETVDWCFRMKRGDYGAWDNMPPSLRALLEGGE